MMAEVWRFGNNKNMEGIRSVCGIRHEYQTRKRAYAPEISFFPLLCISKNIGLGLFMPNQGDQVGRNIAILAILYLGLCFEIIYITTTVFLGYSFPQKQFCINMTKYILGDFSQKRMVTLYRTHVTNKHTNKQTYKHTNIQTNKHTNIQTSIQTKTRSITRLISAACISNGIFHAIFLQRHFVNVMSVLTQSRRFQSG
jgi:hypothetical protein